ncbi:MAG: NusG domain II-containing protein [Ruminococcus sp.]|jgi:hypothetical protein|nr:NusG domain II-containing protein [Ruminococcus sp.]
MKKKLLKPKEAVIITIFVIFLIAVFFISNKTAQTAEITVITNGLRETFSVDLSEDRLFTLDDMEFLIKGGDIRVIKSDCPGGDCVHQGFAGETGGVIVCVPNRVTIRLSNVKNDYDAII